MKKRLPPGQTETEKWPILDLGVQPDINLKDWTLEVAGLVEKPLVWNWDDFQALEQIEIISDIHCVTTWSRYDNTWNGVAARTILKAVKPLPEARFIVFHSHDGYTTNVPLNRFNDDDVLLAHSWQGKPIGREHGGPVRVIIPKLYFWKSAKWVRKITLNDIDVPGYWEVRGYHNDADPWREERYG